MTTTPCYQCPLCTLYHPTRTGAMECCTYISGAVDCVECSNCGEFYPSDNNGCPSCILLFSTETVKTPHETTRFDPADYGFAWHERFHRWEQGDSHGDDTLTQYGPTDVETMIVRRHGDYVIYDGHWPDGADGAVIMRNLGYDRVVINPAGEVAP